MLGFEDRLSERLLQGADRGIVDLELAQVGPRSSIFDGATEDDINNALDDPEDCTASLDEEDDENLLGSDGLSALEKSPVTGSNVSEGGSGFRQEPSSPISHPIVVM